MARNRSWRFAPGSLDYPLVVAHRGGAGLAPENTLAAFRMALEVGADAIELDVRLTRDGRVAVIHDRTVDRTTGGRGPVGSYTLAELKALDAGSWFGPQYLGERVPTLEEVFDAVPGDFPVYVEMKARGPGAWPLVKSVAGIIRGRGRWDGTMVASFNPVPMALLRAMEPRIVRGYIWSSHHPLPLRARWMCPLVNPHWFAPDRGSLDTGWLARFHAQGKRVAAWDLDVGADMRELREMGLDAAVTDRPDILARQKSGLLQERRT